jgi:hypothetical protein
MMKLFIGSQISGERYGELIRELVREPQLSVQEIIYRYQRNAQKSLADCECFATEEIHGKCFFRATA